MNVMITGAAGFIGGYVVERCGQEGCPVLGVDIREPETKWDGATFECCDVRNAALLRELISAFQPDCIFHLAAQSRPTESLRRPRETMEVNVGGTLNLLESLRTLCTKPRVVLACSSAEYGLVQECELPVKEDHALHPLHPYGVSKVAQDLLGEQYFANYSIPVIRLRIFNTTGPGAIGDVCSDLTRRTVEIELGQQSSMAVGNLTNRRAIVDVRDLVHALWMSIERCVAGEVYNVGTDETHSVEEIAHALGHEVGMQLRFEQQVALVRSFDEPVVHGDNSKFRNCCGWSPEIPLSATLRDMLDWWRVRLAAQCAASS